MVMMELQVVEKACLDAMREVHGPEPRVRSHPCHWVLAGTTPTTCILEARLAPV